MSIEVTMIVESRAELLSRRHAMIFPGRMAAAEWPQGPIDLDGDRW